MPRCLLTDAAVADLQSDLEWHRVQGSPDSGVRMVQLLLKCIEQLELFPRSGRQVPEFGQDAFRELIEPPYRIVDRLQPARLEILRIWRSERLLQSLDQL